MPCRGKRNLFLVLIGYTHELGSWNNGKRIIKHISLHLYRTTL